MLSKSQTLNFRSLQPGNVQLSLRLPPQSLRLRHPNHRLRTFAHAPASSLRRRQSTLISSSYNVRDTNPSVRRRPLLESQRFTSSTAVGEASVPTKDAVYTLIDNIHQHDNELAVLLDDLHLLDDYEHVLSAQDWELDHVFGSMIGHRDFQALEAKVRIARQQFGETLPEHHLNDEELKHYERLYGEPVFAVEEEDVVQTEKEPDQLLREDGKGGYEPVEFETLLKLAEDTSVTYDMEDPPPEKETASIARAREVAEFLGGELMKQSLSEESSEEPHQRTHPYTEAGRFGTDPSTIFIPKDPVAGPISAILSSFANKHISESAHRTFGGAKLPHSTVTPAPALQLPQLPIPLTASQKHMSEMEANTFLAVLYPGVYAATMSVLTEVRKRLGSSWLRGLITQNGGPRVLDASGGGAGILAWRDVVRAEYETMVPDHPKDAPIPTGKSTVLAASNALRNRASVMLENTTFLPRLPDYVHVRDSTTLDDERAPPKRKQFDVVIAPYSIQEISEEYLRKQHVKNLWSLLNPDGGVLVLIEKGRQRGFEAIAGAREMLLEKHIASPDSAKHQSLTESGDYGPVKKEPGMIIAPCTNHGKCPMYLFPGQSKGRTDFCHFKQRYIRPNFLQRIVGATEENHDDVDFSYLAVQRGVDLRETEGISQGQQATDAAFSGYEEEDDRKFSSLSVPRVMFSPIKRRGHVILDLCTPAGKIERWTVPRSFSRQAYRDARKAQWGDLWALGAKTRISRNLRIGSKTEESKKERLERRAAMKAAQTEEEKEIEEDIKEDQAQKKSSLDPAVIAALAHRDQSIAKKKTGSNIPSWKKRVSVKKVRQAYSKKTLHPAAE